jgi:hypothetical protein
MKRTPLKRKSPLKAKKKVKKAVKKKRIKLPPLSKLRTKCDSLLTPIARARSPQCEGCGGATQVGHHWIEKSRSAYLRYDLRNIIALCHSCHSRIHNRFGNSVTGAYDVADRIVQQRGREWKEALDKDAHKIVKVNREWYEEHYERLSINL